MPVKRSSAPAFLLASDLDHTMVQNEDQLHEHLLRFNRIWNQGPTSSCLLVYSTGRSPRLFERLWSEAPLLLPDVMICSVGTEIFYRSEDGNSFEPDKEWNEFLDQGGWDRWKAADAAKELPELVPQADTEQRLHKLSYHLKTNGSSADKVINQLRESLAAAGVKAKVIYSGGMDVDILPERAGKGCALQFLLHQLKDAGLYPTHGVQVNGDSGNDVELFEVEGVRGCVVANAHPELDAFYKANPSPHIYKSKLPCSGGIVEALSHFGTLPKLEEGSPAREVVAAAVEALSTTVPVVTESGTPPATCTLVSPVGIATQAPAVSISGAPESAPPHGIWLDRVVVNELADGLWLVACLSYKLTNAGMRDTSAIKAGTVVLQQQGPGTFLLRHRQWQEVQATAAGVALRFIEDSNQVLQQEGRGTSSVHSLGRGCISRYAAL